jgi:hypothetical protein
VITILQFYDSLVTGPIDLSTVPIIGPTHGILSLTPGKKQKTIRQVRPAQPQRGNSFKRYPCRLYQPRDRWPPPGLGAVILIAVFVPKVLAIGVIVQAKPWSEQSRRRVPAMTSLPCGRLVRVPLPQQKSSLWRRKIRVAPGSDAAIDIRQCAVYVSGFGNGGCTHDRNIPSRRGGDWDRGTRRTGAVAINWYW